MQRRTRQAQISSTCGVASGPELPLIPATVAVLSFTKPAIHASNGNTGKSSDGCAGGASIPHRMCPMMAVVPLSRMTCFPQTDVSRTKRAGNSPILNWPSGCQGRKQVLQCGLIEQRL